MKDFNLFMSQLQETNQTLGFFCDFDKISRNVHEIRLSLCMLNSLLGAEDMRGAVQTIWDRGRFAFDVLDILVAVRREKNAKGRCVLASDGSIKDMSEYKQSVDGILTFIEETGLCSVFKEVSDLNDYVFGIETGLDSNARKNRGGTIMEQTVAEIFTEAGITSRQQVNSVEWPEINAVLGKDLKRFDFVVETNSLTYLIEVNFFSGPGGGSKLNEVARSYSDIAPKVNAVPGFEFVWITDGGGWRSARNKLQEAYSIIPKVYNLTNIGEFLDIVRDDTVLLQIAQ